MGWSLVGGRCDARSDLCRTNTGARSMHVEMSEINQPGGFPLNVKTTAVGCRFHTPTMAIPPSPAGGMVGGTIQHLRQPCGLLIAGKLPAFTFMDRQRVVAFPRDSSTLMN